MSRYGSTAGHINQQGWFVQAGYKLAGLNLELPVINNMELVGRYDYVHDGMNQNPAIYGRFYLLYHQHAALRGRL